MIHHWDSSPPPPQSPAPLPHGTILSPGVPPRVASMPQYGPQSTLMSRFWAVCSGHHALPLQCTWKPQQELSEMDTGTPIVNVHGAVKTLAEAV